MKDADFFFFFLTTCFTSVLAYTQLVTARESVRVLFLSRGCWSPFTGKCLPLPLPSAPIASSLEWWLSVSQEMRWNKYPLPAPLLLMSVTAHLLWIVWLKRQSQGHASTTRPLLVVCALQMESHFWGGFLHWLNDKCESYSECWIKKTFPYSQWVFFLMLVKSFTPGKERVSL